MNRTFDFCLDIVLNIYKEKPVAVRMVEPKKKKGKNQPNDKQKDAQEENVEEQKQEEEVKIENEQGNTPPKYKQIPPVEFKESVIPYFDSNLYDLFEPNIEELSKSFNPKQELESSDWVIFFRFHL